MNKSKINVEAVRAFRRLYPNVGQRTIARALGSGDTTNIRPQGVHDTEAIAAGEQTSDWMTCKKFYSFYNIIRRHDRLERQKLMSVIAGLPAASLVTGRLTIPDPSIMEVPSVKWNVAVLSEPPILSIAGPSDEHFNIYVGAAQTRRGNEPYSVSVNHVPRADMTGFLAYEEHSLFDIDGPPVSLHEGCGGCLILCTTKSRYYFAPYDWTNQIVEPIAEDTVFPVLWKAE